MMWDKNTQMGVIAVCSFLVLLGMFLLYHYYKNQAYCSYYKDMEIQGLIRQAARWAVASQQDKSPMISLLHANYGAGYLQALELIATENEINRFANLQKLRMKIYGTQDNAARRVITSCPQFVGDDIDKELAMVGINIKDDTTPN